MGGFSGSSFHHAYARDTLTFVLLIQYMIANNVALASSQLLDNKCVCVLVFNGMCNTSVTYAKEASESSFYF